MYIIMRKFTTWIAAVALAGTMLVPMPMFCDTSTRLTTQADGQVAAQLIQQTDARMAEIPDCINNLLAEEGWKIYVTDKNLSRTYFNGAYRSIAGVTCPDEKKIEFESRPRAINRAYAHEVGHAFDAHFNQISYTDAWKAIYNAEKNTFRPHGAIGDNAEISSPTEFFASIFQDCLISPQTCRQTAPTAYAFVQTLINQTAENYSREVQAEQQTKLVTQQFKNS